MKRLLLVIPLGLVVTASARAQREIDLGRVSPDLRVIGRTPLEYCGYQVDAGDVNGDGIGDLIVSSPKASDAEASSGRIYVLFGDVTSSRPATIDLSEREPDLLFMGNQRGEMAGRCGIVLDDVDDDGIDDIVLPVRLYSAPGRPGCGAVFILKGRRGLASGQTIELEPENMDLTILGPEPNGHLGRDLECGDFNDDGHTDIALCAYTATPAPDRTEGGAVYVIYGEGKPRPPGSVIDLAGCEGLEVWSPEAGANLGVSLSLDDVQGDGVPDLVMGAQLLTSPTAGPKTGGIVVLFGGKHHRGSERIDLAKQKADVTIHAPAGGRAGYSSDSGDFDGDGIADIAIGSRYANSRSRPRTGAVWLVRGDADWSSGTVVDLEVRSPDVILEGGPPRGELGRDVWMADVDGDGLDDLIAGAWEARRFKLKNVGAVHVVYGRRELGSPPLRVDVSEQPADISIYGNNEGGRLGVRMRVGDLDGDGRADLVLGAHRSSSGDRLEAGEAIVLLNATLTGTDRSPWLWVLGGASVLALGGTLIGLYLKRSHTPTP